MNNYLNIVGCVLMTCLAIIFVIGTAALIVWAACQAREMYTYWRDVKNGRN